MATNDVIINPGTEITFQSAGGTVAMTVDDTVTAGTGWKSDLCTLAAAYTTPRPFAYRWTCKAFWGAGAVVGEMFRLLIAEANADGEFDGGVTAGDLAFTDEDGLKNIKNELTPLICTHATEEQEYTSGKVQIMSNKIVLVGWNGSVAAGMHATATNFEFKLLPIPAAPAA